MTQLNDAPQMEQTTAPSIEDVHNAIANVNPDVVLRNLAFWLDIAVARGRWNDGNMMVDNSSGDALSKSEDDTKSEV